jgi:uncharacterized membrane protein YkvA (DUF1232 family)
MPGSDGGSGYYSGQSFWRKCGKFAKKAGAKLLYAALLLYYTLQKPNVPKWAKRVIYGALGYFILPLDAIPDGIPAIGLSDDLGILLAALSIIGIYVDKETKEKAANKLSDWFGPGMNRPV